ncbi:autotransporter outer membrane beta-barrel domain-containing protein [Burkholderia vietnamiensis]|uniref:autotransporter outer membrane beta-barrel domain-containing protein n=1 Tax=Burkholderia vietnamiensis TaxID=60552 RepID=UPI001CF2363D|nr:autotransporter outer membrane beta-barrel domain-containing protein [Burkholderia vietnamiensis]MCA8448850.1 autotransporter domain-containing protein [Burkholderia vietnamiensis]
MKHFNRSFNLRRTTVSIAVAAALSIAAQGAYAQVTITSSQSTVDISGDAGVTVGPPANVSVSQMTNTGTVSTTGNAGLTNYGNVGSVTNSGSISGATNGIENESGGYISSITNTGAIGPNGFSGNAGIDNKSGGTIYTITNSAGGTIGSGTSTQYAIENEVNAMIQQITDNGGLVVGLMNGLAYVDNAGTIYNFEEDGSISSVASGMNGFFVNEATGTVSQFTVGTNGRVILSGSTPGIVNAGTFQTIWINGTLNAGGDALVNGSSSNASASIQAIEVNGVLAGQGGNQAGNGIHNYGTITSIEESSTGKIQGSGVGTAAINNEATGTIGSVVLMGISGAEGAVLWNKGTVGDVSIGATFIATGVTYAGQASASAASAIENDAGATMGNLSVGAGSVVETLGTGNTYAAVQNSGTMASITDRGTIDAANGVAVVVSSTGTVTNGITVGSGGTISGKSGIEIDGDVPTIDVQAGGVVSGTTTAGIELNNGATTLTVDGAVTGTGSADAVQVTNANTTATITVEGNGSLQGTVTGNGLTVGGGATANVTVQDNGNIETFTTGTAVDVKNAGTVNLTLTGNNAKVQNLGNGSAIKDEAGGDLTVNATGFSTGGAGPVITAAGTAATIDIAGTAALNLDALVSNTNTTSNAGAAIQIESTGNVTSLTNQGEVQGAVKNLSSNALVIDGASSYTDGTATNGQLGLFSGFGSTSTQSEIDSPNADVTIASGNVVLNDAVTAPNLNVASGAALISYAPVSVNGNFNVEDGATLVSQVQSTTNYGQWNVTGNTTFVGATTLKLMPYTSFGFADGQRFLEVSTAGTASYNLAGISVSALGYAGSVTVEQVGNNLYAVLGSTSTGTGTGTGTDTGTGTGTGSTDTGSGTDTGTTTTTTGTGTDTGTGTGTGTTSPTTPVVHSVAGLTQTSVAATNGIVRYTGWNSAGLMSAENVVLAIEQNGTAQQVTKAGTQLAPIPHAQAGNAMLAIGDAAQGVVADRAEAQRVAKQAGVATPSGVTTWGRAFGGAEQRGTTAGGTYGEVSGSNLTFGGLAIGVDKAVSPTLTVGGAFSYANGQSNATGDASGQRLSDNAFGLTFYQNWTATSGRVYVDVSENASLHRFNESRSIDLAGVSAGGASGRFNGTSYGARVEAGLPLALRNGIDVTPFVALGVQHLSLGSYTENDGGSGVGLNVNGASYTSVRTTVGVKVSKSFETKAGTVNVYLKPALVHEFAGSPSNTTAVFNGDSTAETSFTTVSATPVRNIADVAVGATLYRAKGLSLNAQVNVQAGSHYTGVAGGVQAKWSF